VPDTLDAEIVKDGAPFFEDGEKMQLSYAVRNTHRTIGTRALQPYRQASSACGTACNPTI
jgi:hypothetical protein